MIETRDQFEVWSNDFYIETIGNAEQVREWFEEKLEDAIGFFVMLQESTEEGFKI